MNHGGGKMLEKYFRNKEKVLENLKQAYTYYMRNAEALEKAANELRDTAKQTKEYVREVISEFDEFGDTVDEDLLAGYLTNAKKDQENAKNLLKRSIAYRAAANSVKSIYLTLKYSDIGANDPKMGKIPAWAKKIINGDLPTLDEITVQPPVSMGVADSSVKKELHQMIAEYKREKLEREAEKSSLDKVVSDAEKL